MKIFLLLLFGALFMPLLSSQPSIQWQKSLGGSQYDAAGSIQQTNDGGYIVVGTTQSSDGDVSGQQGVVDVWALKLDSNGNILWQKTLGGSSVDVGNSMQLTSDGGLILAGFTISNNGDVSGNHGAADGWIVKLDSNGAVQWQKVLGGSLEDKAQSIRQTNDGGYIVAGYTASNDGDVSDNHGGNDFWVLKLNSVGTLEWEKTLGGTWNDEAYSVRQTTDGGYVVGGATYSNDGDVSGNNGTIDYWVVKLTNTGTIEWQKALGGSGADDGRHVIQTTDGGYIVAGTEGSGDGQVTGSHGKTDGWVVKLNQTGDLQWQKTLGGSQEDALNAIQPTSDGGCVIAAFTQSSDGDVLGDNVIADIWVVKLNAMGDIQWGKTLGGTEFEYPADIQKTIDGGFVVAGSAESNDGDVTGNHGSNDLWVVKLSVLSSATSSPVALPLEIFPNPASQSISIKIPTDESSITISISDLLGRIVSRQTISNTDLGSEKIDIAALADGVYFLTATMPSGKVFVGKFRKE